MSDNISPNQPTSSNENEEKKGKKSAKGLPKNPPIKTLMDIWDVLAEHASPETPLTISEIAKHLNEDRQNQFVLSGGKSHLERYGYTEEELKDYISDRSTRNALPSSGKSVGRHIPKDIDAINTVMPHTVVCEADTATALLAYPTQDALHIVIEDPHGEVKYDGDVSFILNTSPPPSVQKSSLNRTLPNLMEEFHEANTYFIKRPPILSLNGVVKENGKFRPASGEAADEGRSSTRRYYLKSLLTKAEWKIFYDLISVYPYIDSSQTEKFLSVLRRIAPGNQDWPTNRFAPKSKASLQFSHIEKLDKAIKEQTKVSLTYGLYLLEQNERGMLRPALKAQKDFSKGDENQSFVHKVEPYAMMWSNGYYYLVGKTAKGMRNFRMDRVVSVHPMKESFERDPNFDPYKYRDSSPVMHSGKPVFIIMRCPISLLGAVQDTFGSSVRDYTSRYALPDSDGKARYTNVSLSASEEGAKLFAMQYADQVEILEPAALRDAVAKSLSAALEKYQK